jgi:hypothetical protein
VGPAANICQGRTAPHTVVDGSWPPGTGNEAPFGSTYAAALAVIVIILLSIIVVMALKRVEITR